MVDTDRKQNPIWLALLDFDFEKERTCCTQLVLYFDVQLCFINYMIFNYVSRMINLINELDFR